MQKLLADGCGDKTLRGQDLVIPLPEITLNLPAVAVHGKNRAEKREFLGDAADVVLTKIQLEFGQKGENALLYGADLAAVGIENFQAMPPGKLPLDGVQNGTVLGVDIVGIKPRENTLAKQHLHNKSP